MRRSRPGSAARCCARLAGVRLDRFLPLVAAAQAALLLFAVVRISRQVEARLSLSPGRRGIQLLPRGTLSALNTSRLPPLSFNGGHWRSAPHLPRAVNIRQEQEYLELLQALDGIFKGANVEYIMCDGTLLGSFMSHGFLPWDDDADVMVNIRDSRTVEGLMSDPKVNSTFGIRRYHNDLLDDYPDVTATMYSSSETYDSPPQNTMLPGYRDLHKFKFFRHQSRQAGSMPWKWPYVDVKYYEDNGTHVTNIDFWREVFHVPRDMFFPLSPRPFGTLWLPAPWNSRAYLRAKYKKFSCQSSSWNHKLERKKHKKRVDCRALTASYPFVWRYRVEGGVLETLRVGQSVLHTVALGQPYQGRHGPFIL